MSGFICSDSQSPLSQATGDNTFTHSLTSMIPSFSHPCSLHLELQQNFSPLFYPCSPILSIPPFFHYVALCEGWRESSVSTGRGGQRRGKSELRGRVYIHSDGLWWLRQDRFCFLVHLYEVYVLKEFLYEASRWQAEHTVGQQVRHLRVQTHIKRIGKLLLYPL